MVQDKIVDCQKTVQYNHECGLGTFVGVGNVGYGVSGRAVRPPLPESAAGFPLHYRRVQLEMHPLLLQAMATGGPCRDAY